MQNEVAEVIPLPLLAARLPEPPPASLDPVLDAAVECFARHGLSKTSLSDIARELGVAPSTVYRKVGSVENASLLIMAREGKRMLESIPDVIAGVEGPRVITVFLAHCVTRTAENAMVAKVLRDEVDWMGRLATRTLDERLAQAAETAAPLLEAAMDAGLVRRQDPLDLARWIVRIGMISLLAPPPGDLVDALDVLLLPVLDPGGGASR